MTKKKNKAKPSFKKEDFFTRDAANEGIRVPLFDPATGQDTEHWFQVLGQDSDTYRKEDRRGARRVHEIFLQFAEDEEKRDAALHDMELDLRSRLVIAWSFEEPCTPLAVREFFRRAPQLGDQVDRVAAKRALFFGRNSTNSPSTPSGPSDSTSTPKDPSKPSEPA